MEMNGWDVVSLVTVPFINAAIHREGGSPTKMQLSTDTMAVQAEFGSWQITVGGAANMLMFDIPLSYIRGRVTKDRQTIAHFSYQSLAARVQLVLKFVNSKEKSHDLVVDPTNPPTSLVSLMDANGRPLPSAIDKAFITEALTTWLNGNLSEFNHVFASVELNPGVGSDTQWAFCKPSVVVYKPYLVDLQIAVQNSVIKTYSKTSTIVLDEFYGTVTAFNESESWMTLGLDASRQALTYTNTQPPINNHHTEQSISFTIIQDILQALGIVAIVIAAVLTDGAALLAIGALSGVASGGAQWALASFESGHRNDAPEINNLVSNLTLPVRWSRTGPFATTQAGLHQGGFFLAGTIRQDEKQT
ncbi:hypothetical protein ACKLNR_015301 [Fusarium oxysporum f. sp. zingiberi]